MSGSSAPQPGIERAKALRLAKMFDLRTFIGTLFVIFGTVVTVEGVVAPQVDIEKAAGINISLWTGLVMLVVGLGFIAWMLVAPPSIEVKTEDLGHAPDVH